MTEEFAYEVEEFMDSLAPVMITNSLSSLFGIVAYILSSIALYSLASRRGIRHAWLAWIPIGSLWILGSLADQYRYVSRGEVKNKRKTLLTLSIVQMVLAFIMVFVIIGAVFMAVGSQTDEEIFASIFGPMMGVLLLCLPVAGVAIATLIIRYMALYDVYRSAAPDNAVMFLVLSIFFKITEPFFLFFNRLSDKGMVREQPQPAYQAPPYVDAPQAGGSWSQPQQPQNAQDPQSYQNPEGSQEPWTEKPEDQDPWNQGPEQL